MTALSASAIGRFASVEVVSVSRQDTGRRFLGDYLTEKQLAEELGRSVRHLKRWRAQGLGPPVTRIGRTAVYKIDSVRAWLESHEKQPLAEGNIAA
jgi:hypothetical protein